MRVLLVEGTAGEANAALLERIGHTVDWETEGQLADEVLQVQDFQLLVLDVNLSSLDGFRLLKRL